MNNKMTTELDRLQNAIDEAKSPQAKSSAQDDLLRYLDAYIAKHVQLTDDRGPAELREAQERMRGRLETWDKEARAILEREISDPEVLRAALDNSRYKEEVIALTGTPLSELGRDRKDPAVTKAREILAEAKERERFRARLERLSVVRPFVVMLWVFVIGILAVIILGALSILRP
jgi:hypothetical protein